MTAIVTEIPMTVQMIINKRLKSFVILFENVVAEIDSVFFQFLFKDSADFVSLQNLFPTKFSFFSHLRNLFTLKGSRVKILIFFYILVLSVIEIF